MGNSVSISNGEVRVSNADLDLLARAAALSSPSVRAVVAEGCKRAGAITAAQLEKHGLGDINRLTMNGCGLEEVPSVLASLKRLQVLDLDNNRLKTMASPTIVRMAALTALSMQRNLLEKDIFGSLSPITFASLNNLSVLDLSHNNMTTFPEELLDFSKLSVLRMSHNNFLVLPESIKRLKNLTELNVSSNRLTRLPDELRELKLQSLFVTDNPLLPEALQLIADLKKAVPNLEAGGRSKQGLVAAVQALLESDQRRSSAKRESGAEDAGFGAFHMAFENLMESLNEDDKQKLKTKALTLDEKWTLLQSKGFKVDEPPTPERSNSPLSQRSISIGALPRQVKEGNKDRSLSPLVGSMTSSPMKKRLPASTQAKSSPFKRVADKQADVVKDLAYFVLHLKNGTISVEDIACLCDQLEQQDEKWKKKFVSFGGANLLLQMLAVFATRQGRFTAEDEARQMELLRCYNAAFSRREREVMDKVVAGGGLSLKTVKSQDVDEKYAFQVVAGNGGWHKGISPNHAQQLQSLSLQMLWTASQVNHPKAAAAVLEAFDFVKQENMGDSRFDQLMQVLEKKELGTNNLKSTVIGLINGLISGTNELGQRCSLRKEFLALSIEKHFARFEAQQAAEEPSSSQAPGAPESAKEGVRSKFADFKHAMAEDCEEVFERHGLQEVMKLRPKVHVSSTESGTLFVLPVITGDLSGKPVVIPFNPATTTVQAVKEKVIASVKAAGETPVNDALLKEFALHIPAPPKSSEPGVWLDDNSKKLSSYGLDGEVAAQFKPKPWQVEIKYFDDSDKAFSSTVSLDPCVNSHLLVEKLCAQFYGDAIPFKKTPEDYCLYSPPKGFLLSRRSRQAGFFVEKTRKLLSYECLSGKARMLELKLAPIVVPGKVAGGAKEPFRLDPNSQVSAVFDLLADKCMIAASVRPDYCLYLHKTKAKKDRDGSKSRRTPSKDRLGIESPRKASGGRKEGGRSPGRPPRADRSAAAGPLVAGARHRKRSPGGSGGLSPRGGPTGDSLSSPRKTAPGGKLSPRKEGKQKKVVKEYILDKQKKLRDYKIKGSDLLVLALSPTAKETRGKRMSLMSILKDGVIAPALVGECQRGLPNRYSLYARDAAPPKGEPHVDRRTCVLEELKDKLGDLTFNHKLDIGSVWDEPPDGNIEYEDGKIRAATLNQLAAQLTPDSGDYDREFVDAFFTTCPTFCTLLQLLAKIVERWEPGDDVCDESTKNRVRMRVLLILSEWVEHYPEFFKYSGESLPPIHLFYELMKIDGHGDHVRMLQAKANNPKALATSYQMPKMVSNSKVSFLDLNSMDIARQICLKTYPTFCAIQAIELLGQAWTKDSLKGLAKNVLGCIADFNHFSHWVSTMILAEEKVRHRAKVMAKMIDVAEKLLELNNFQILMAFISGLNVSAISRLKWTMAKLPKSSRKSLLHLEEVMSMQSSFKVYRELLVNAEPPGIPYLGVMLQDITFIEDGNLDYVVSHMINFTKRWMLYSTISTIRKFQQSAYKFRPVPNVLTMLDLKDPMDDDTLYKLSLQREPRNASRSKIA